MSGGLLGTVCYQKSLRSKLAEILLQIDRPALFLDAHDADRLALEAEGRVVKQQRAVGLIADELLQRMIVEMVAGRDAHNVLRPPRTSSMPIKI